MEIDEVLGRSEVIIDVRSSDKARVLKELARLAANKLGLPRDEVSEALLKREELGSTGTGDGIALPHARLAGVDKRFALLARLVKPIDFAAIDDRPVDIVCLLLLPGKSQAEPLNALACVARKLRDPAAIRDVRRAPDVASLYDALTEG
jgi:nitrogen PTS system EIIA component